MEYLTSYSQVLERGWSPNNMRQEQGLEELAKIKADPIAFLASLDSTKVLGDPIPMPDAKALGLSYVELTVSHDNTISQRVIEKCGGVFVEVFPLPVAYGEGTEWRYRIAV